MQCRAIPYEGNEPFVFFSYSHKDAERAYPILEQMVRDGFRIWYDDGNHAGDDWLENIGQHLDRCSVCLAMLSQNAEQSHNCKKEVSFAVQCNKKLLAVMLEEFAMTMGMRLQLSTIHYLKKSEYPSTTALLNKLYESESLGECRAAPGSILMRTIVDEVQEDKAPEKKNVLDAFLASEIKQTEQEAVMPEQVADQPQEERPQGKKQQAKLKVRRVAKVAHKVEEKREIVPIADAVEAVADQEQEAEVQTLPEDEQIIEDQKVLIQAAERTDTIAEEPEEPDEAPDDEEKTVYVRHKEMDEDSDSATVLSTDQNKDAVLIRMNSREVHFIASALTRIGRSSKKCDFAIADNPSVSNHHADLIFYNDSYYLKDAGSSNGTFVEETQLEADQQIKLSNMSIFRISDEPVMLVFGRDVTDCKMTGKLAFLMNTATYNAKMIGAGGIELDRRHKWKDGTFSSKEISREHAVIRYIDGEFVLEDLGSRNGTYLNDRKIAANEKIVLQDKARICLTDSILEFGLISI